MKILICDDDEVYLNFLHDHINAYMQKHHIPCTIIATMNPQDVSPDESQFDLAFLDIHMPGVDGITLARTLQQRNPKLLLFFITGYPCYQDDAMNLRPFRFFEKPVAVDRLYAGLEKAIECISEGYVELFLSDNNALQRVSVDDILYITRDSRRGRIVTSEKEYSSVDTYDDLCAKIPQSFFYPVHKSFYVNLHYVDRYTYSELLLTDGTKIPIASRKQSAFHRFWFDFLKKR